MELVESVENEIYRRIYDFLQDFCVFREVGKFNFLKESLIMHKQ